MSGLLILCATPIGNLGDTSARLGEALGTADVVYAEDTRRTGRLLEHLGVSVPLRSYFVGNEASRADELATRLAGGATVALVTDAGTPGISDPGYSAVQAALEAGAQVTVVPGPSAVTAALVASGLPADRFVFESFLPRKGRDRSERLDQLAVEPRTIVLFTTKARLVADLTDLARSLGADRRCVVARELTKAHEEIWRGSLGAAVEHWSAVEPRGEFTIVLEGGKAVDVDLDPAVEQCLERIAAGTSTAEAVREVAVVTGVSRRELYEAVIRKRPT